jgi:hypothetical protein
VPSPLSANALVRAETVTHLLSRFGPVESTSIVTNKFDSTCRGYAFVVFESERYLLWCGWVMPCPPSCSSSFCLSLLSPRSSPIVVYFSLCFSRPTCGWASCSSVKNALEASERTVTWGDTQARYIYPKRIVCCVFFCSSLFSPARIFLFFGCFNYAIA